MKTLFLFFAFCAITATAQTNLEFNKRYIDCENRWVALPMSNDNTYVFGFVYIDEEAGLTLNYEGSFKIIQGIFIPTRLDSTSIKYRIEPSNGKVSIIPESKFNELKIPIVPDWLKYYKADTSSAKHFYKLGFIYNLWDECSIALTYLEKAKSIDPEYKALAFEFAYAYNALKQYDKAKIVLESALLSNPDNCYLYKELSFAQLKSGELDKASETCKTGIKKCSDKTLKCEIAFNLAGQYYMNKDLDNFHIWAKETLKWATRGDKYDVNIKNMKKELKDKPKL